MFTDPIACAGTTPVTSWKRVRTDGYGAEYLDVGTGITAIVNHTKTKAGVRHYLQLAEKKQAVDPLTGTTKEVIATCSVSLFVPTFGWTEAQAAALYALLVGVIADGDVTINRIIQGES